MWLSFIGALAAVSTPAVAGSPDNVQLLGSCLRAGKPEELSRILFLENRAIELADRNKMRRVSLVGQSVRIENLSATDGTVHVTRMGSIVSKGQDDADISLKLALLNGKSFVYWRETYQHRLYRQGLFEIIDHKLVLFCEGYGGTASSH